MITDIPATAPIDMVMPAGPQLAFALGNGIAIAVFLVLAWRHWRRAGSPIGFLLLLAGALTVFNEPVVDVLGKCWFPRHGTWPLFEAWGVVIPAWMLPVYGWYVGGQAFMAYRLFQSGVTTRRLFGLYASFAVVNALLEIPGLQLGVYSYYGAQPFAVLGFPLWWTCCNGLMPLVIAGVVLRSAPLLQGLRQAWVVPMGLMAAGATNGAVAVPVWVALNSGSPPWLTHLAALASLTMGLLLCRGLALLVAVDAPLRQGDTASGSHRTRLADTRA